MLGFGFWGFGLSLKAEPAYSYRVEMKEWVVVVMIRYHKRGRDLWAGTCLCHFLCWAGFRLHACSPRSSKLKDLNKLKLGHRSGFASLQQLQHYGKGHERDGPAFASRLRETALREIEPWLPGLLHCMTDQAEPRELRLRISVSPLCSGLAPMQRLRDCAACPRLSLCRPASRHVTPKTNRKAGFHDDPHRKFKGTPTTCSSSPMRKILHLGFSKFYDAGL